MRFILLLALLLYNIVTNSANYDYVEADGVKRHSLNARRDWGKRALSQPVHEAGWHGMYDQVHADPAQEAAMLEREKEMERLPNYNGRRFYRDKSEARPKSAEIHHNFEPKMEEIKLHHIDCAGPNERYESCFAGCAAVSCDNPRDRLRPCYPFCESGCICVHPYVRDDRTHKCVLPEDCTKGLKGIPDLVEETS